MKTSIVIKNTNQKIAFKPKSIADYITSLSNGLKQADRDGNRAIAKVLYEVDEAIKQGTLAEWTDYKSAADFAENLTGIKKSRTSQLIKAHTVYLLMREFYEINTAPDSEYEVDKEFVKALTEYTTTHYYYLKGFEAYEIEQLFRSGTLTANMSVSELTEALKLLKKQNSGEDENGNDNTDESGEENTDEYDEMYITNADEAEEFYKLMLSIINSGNGFKVRYHHPKNPES